MNHKNILIFTTVCLLALLVSGCKDDVTRAGSSALLEGEDVIVCSDTVSNISTLLWEAVPIYTQPDSFLLGECHTNDYGTLKADMLTQFACPEGWQYPDNSVLDSVCLYLYYRSWYGDGQSPLGIRAYMLDGEALRFDSIYPTDVDITQFCSLNDSLRILNSDRVVVASSPTDSFYSATYSAYQPYVRARLSDKWANYLFQLQSYDSQNTFNKHFPGLYITSTYGASVALYVNSLCLTVHYHYTYQTSDGVTHTMNDNKVLYANSEVRQAARYEWQDRSTTYTNLEKDTAVNYILSPAHAYTLIKIPMRQVLEDIDNGVSHRKSTYINYARLRLDVLNGTSTKSKDDNYAAPASTMLLLQEREFDNVFKKNQLPADTVAKLATLTTVYNSSTQTYDSYYDFDLSTILTRQLRLGTEAADTLRMLLLPVDVTYASASTGSYVSLIRMKQAVTATKIMSTRSQSTPLDIEIIYSGFTNTYIGEK